MKRFASCILAIMLLFSGCAASQEDPFRVDTVIYIPVDPTTVSETSVTEAFAETATEVPTEAFTETPTELPTEATTEPKETTAKTTTSKGSSSGKNSGKNNTSTSKNQSAGKKDPVATQPSKETRPLETFPAATTPSCDLPPENISEPSVDVPTEIPTEPATKPPATEHTENPTEPITEPPVTEPTEIPTEPVTEPPAAKPTEIPTETATEPSAVEPTENPTEPVTEPPVVIPTESPTELPTEPPYDPSSYSVGNLEYAILNQLNFYRTQGGLPELSLSGRLSGIAYIRAQEVSVSWSHTRPDGRSYTSAMDDCGYGYGSASENLLYVSGNGDGAAIVDRWMASESNSADILNGSFITAGIGIYRAGGITYVACLLVG